MGGILKPGFERLTSVNMGKLLYTYGLRKIQFGNFNVVLNLLIVGLFT